MSQPLLSLDNLTLRSYLAELRPLLQGAFLQKFSQLSEWDYRLILRQPLYAVPGEEDAGQQRVLFVRLLPGQARIFYGSADSSQAIPPRGFSMLVRKFAQGRPLFDLSQSGLDRILEFKFPAVTLVLELLDRQPNLLLVRQADNKVLGGHQLGKLGERFLRPGLVYVPPPQPELPPADLRPDQAWLEQLALASGPLGKELSGHLFGLPLYASVELIARAGLEAGQPADGQPLSRLLEVWDEFFADLIRPGKSRPGINAEGRLQCFVGPRDRGFASLLQAEASAGEEPAAEKSSASLVTRRSLQQRLNKAIQKLVRHQANLQQDQAKVGDVERLQHLADLLIHHKDTLPRGPARVELTDWDGVGTFACELEPGLSALQMSHKLYQKAAKYRRAVPILAARIEAVRLQEAETRSWLAALQDLHDPQLLASFSASIEARLDNSARPAAAPVKPASGEPRRFTLGGFAILVGRNPVQNERLVAKLAAREDLWLHARDFPGSHVLVKTAGRLAGPEVVEGAAVLAARYSRGSAETRLTVVCTQARRVRRAPGGPVGKMLYEDELTLVVDPQACVEGLHGL